MQSKNYDTKNNLVLSSTGFQNSLSRPLCAKTNNAENVWFQTWGTQVCSPWSFVANPRPCIDTKYLSISSEKIFFSFPYKLTSIQLQKKNSALKFIPSLHLHKFVCLTHSLSFWRIPLKRRRLCCCFLV